MVRREHSGIVYRAPRARCEPRDNALFPPMPNHKHPVGVKPLVAAIGA